MWRNTYTQIIYIWETRRSEIKTLNDLTICSSKIGFCRPGPNIGSMPRVLLGEQSAITDSQTLSCKDISLLYIINILYCVCSCVALWCNADLLWMCSDWLCDFLYALLYSLPLFLDDIPVKLHLFPVWIVDLCDCALSSVAFALGIAWANSEKTLNRSLSKSSVSQWQCDVPYIVTLELEGAKIPLCKVAAQHLLTPRGQYMWPHGGIQFEEYKIWWLAFCQVKCKLHLSKHHTLTLYQRLNSINWMYCDNWDDWFLACVLVIAPTSHAIKQSFRCVMM